MPGVMITPEWQYNISRQVFLPAFMQRMGTYSWDWERLFTVGTSDHATEQIFEYAGLGAAQSMTELGPITFASLSELAKTTFTHSKFGLGIAASDELVEDGHYVDVLKEGATGIADGLDYMVDYSVATLFNRAFTTTAAYYLADGAAMCSTHTLNSGGTLLNALGSISPNYDNVWLAQQYFDNTLVRQDGLPLVDKGAYILANPLKKKLIETWRVADRKPGTADNDKVIGVTDLQSIYSRYLSTNYWFVLGEQAKKDLMFFWRWRKRVETWRDNARGGQLTKALIRFSVGCRSGIRIVGSPGAS